jgi:hypothetical protein
MVRLRIKTIKPKLFEAKVATFSEFDSPMAGGRWVHREQKQLNWHNR